MAETKSPNKPNKTSNRTHSLPPKEPERKPTWSTLKGLFSRKSSHPDEGNKKKKQKVYGKIGSYTSLCSIKDSSRVTHRQETSCPKRIVHDQDKEPLSSSFSSFSDSSVTATSFSTASSHGGSFRRLPLRRLSGCYECHTVVGQINGVSRHPSLMAPIATCSFCGMIFKTCDALELHQATKHSVSVLGPEDTGRNIVEIIFQSSWLKKNALACKIDRILKINITKTTIASFEDYRDFIKSKASKKHPRCTADGNELLRFYSTTFTCSLGLNGSTNLCHPSSTCSMCGIIREGFKVDGSGRIRTMATSGRAHDIAGVPSGAEKRAMVVCRVIAGRVGNNRSQEAREECDSIAWQAGMYLDLDELFVFSPKAILPCFVVIYGGL